MKLFWNVIIPTLSRIITEECETQYLDIKYFNWVKKHKQKQDLPPEA